MRDPTISPEMNTSAISETGPNMSTGGEQSQRIVLQSKLVVLQSQLVMKLTARGGIGWITCLVIIMAAGSAAWAGAKPRQAVRVVDGDTLVIRGQKIRLWGVDAPEVRQSCSSPRGAEVACGRMAKTALRDLVGRETPDCVRVDRDRYNRTVARCSIRGQDIGLSMLRQGWAMRYTLASDNRPWEAIRRARYLEAEVSARTNGRGIWAWEGSLHESMFYAR